MDEKKVLRLVPESPYFNHVKVGVYDENAGEWRKRCMIDVEYGESDIADIKKKLRESGKIEGTDEILAHYKAWMYDLIKRLISSDWIAESGEEEVLAIVKEHL